MGGVYPPMVVGLSVQDVELGGGKGGEVCEEWVVGCIYGVGWVLEGMYKARLRERQTWPCEYCL